MSDLDSVIFHTSQDETSHFSCPRASSKTLGMTESEIFRSNLERLRNEQGLKAAELSKKAGLNRRAVTDIEDGRVKSPKLETVIKLAKALQQDPGTMIGMAPWQEVSPKLADFLGRYDQDAQEQLLTALQGIAPEPGR